MEYREDKLGFLKDMGPGLVAIDPENLTGEDLRYLDKLDKTRKDILQLPKTYPCQWAEY